MRSSTISKYIGRLACAAAVAAAACLPAYAQQSSEEVDPARSAFFEKLKGKKVVFVAHNQASEQGQVWFQSLKDTLEPLGVNVAVRDAKFDPAVGAQALTQAIAQGVDMLVVWSPDRSSYARLIKQAEQKGIWVVSMNMGSSSVADNFIGPDWMDITKRQLEASAKACEGKSGKISIVGGANNSAVDVLGMAGINAALKNHPELKIVNSQFADWDANKAKDITGAVLKQNPDLCAVIGMWNLMDYGTAAAISEAGLTGKVFLSTSGSGLADGACDRVKNGAFDLYVSYNVQRQYDQIATVVQALLGSDVKPGELKSFSYTPLTDITKANSDAPGACWTLAQFGK
jgi:ribose transport system substrate-binding protein